MLNSFCNDQLTKNLLFFIVGFLVPMLCMGMHKLNISQYQSDETIALIHILLFVRMYIYSLPYAFPRRTWERSV